MPIYEFSCNCGHEFEVLAKAGTAPPDCPACGATPLTRKMSMFSVGRNAVADPDPPRQPEPPLRNELRNVTLQGPPGGMATGIRTGGAPLDMKDVAMEGLATGLEVEAGGEVDLDNVGIRQVDAGIKNSGRVRGRKVSISKRK